MAVEGLWASLNTTCNSTFCPQADWAGCVLRLAGHDFMDFDGEKGGADGCLDFADQDNAGLQACLNQGSTVFGCRRCTPSSAISCPLPISL